jgi:protease-4
LTQTNKHITNIINQMMITEMHIEEHFGFAALSTYLLQIEQMSAGVPYSALGMSQQRDAWAPKLFDINSASKRETVRNPYALGDSSRTPRGSVALLSLKGTMMMDGGACAYGISDTIEFLQAATDNPNVAGIVFDVRTGGGESTAGELLMQAVQSAEKKKPVMAYIDNMMASAGVMAMLPATEIIASSQRAQIGSIGTYMSISKEFLSWYSENVTDVYADESTAKNDAFRKAVAGDLSGIKAMVNKVNRNFLSDVKNFRPLQGDTESTLSGAMFDAPEAKRRGLIDAVGSFDYAMRRMQYHINSK